MSMTVVVPVQGLPIMYNLILMDQLRIKLLIMEKIR